MGVLPDSVTCVVKHGHIFANRYDASIFRAQNRVVQVRKCETLSIDPSLRVSNGIPIDSAMSSCHKLVISLLSENRTHRRRDNRLPALLEVSCLLSVVSYPSQTSRPEFVFHPESPSSYCDCLDI